MLGLGNALTRSINFGKVATSIFNNAPSIGEEYEGGIVVSVNEYFGPQNANAVIDVVYPYLIQFESNSNYFDTDYIDAAISYVKSYKTIKNGVVYDGWIPADGNAVEYWLDNIYSENTYTANSNKSVDYIAAVSPIYLDWHESHDPVSGNLPIDDYSGPTANTLSVYATNNLNVRYNPQQIFYQNNTVSLVLKRRIFTTLEYNEQIPIQSAEGNSLKNIGSEFFDISTNDFNENTDNKGSESESPYNILNISTDNFKITCTIKFSLGSDILTYQDKLQEIPEPWRNLNTSVSAKFNLVNAGHLGFTTNLPPSFSSLISTPIRKATQNALQDDLPPPAVNSFHLLNNDIVFHINPLTNEVYEIYKARVFEVDVTNYSFLPIFYSLVSLGFQKTSNPTSFDSVYHDGSDPTADEILNQQLTVGQAHASKGLASPLPLAVSWARYSIKDLRFTSKAYIESEQIETPASLQNIIVPLISSAPYGQELINYNSWFNIQDYFSSAVGPSDDDDQSKSINVVSSVKYFFDSITEMNSFDIPSTAAGELAFIGPSGPNGISMNSLYEWSGSQWDLVSASEGDTYNLRGNMYRKKSTTGYERLISTDIINYSN